VAKLLRATITTDPSLSAGARVKPLNSALAKLDRPAPTSEPLPPPKSWTNSRRLAAEAEAMSGSAALRGT
jgi:hypothetical protein